MTISSDFTPLSALLGGGLIGLAASVLLLSHGQIAGVSGVLGGLLSPDPQDRSYRVSFLAGLLIAGLLLLVARPAAFASGPLMPLPATTVAGLLVGYGTRLGGGCTSGHGVCGLSRLSLRSLVATLAFTAAGILTVYMVRHVGGAS